MFKPGDKRDQRHHHYRLQHYSAWPRCYFILFSIPTWILLIEKVALLFREWIKVGGFVELVFHTCPKKDVKSSQTGMRGLARVKDLPFPSTNLVIFRSIPVSLPNCREAEYHLAVNWNWQGTFDSIGKQKLFSNYITQFVDNSVIKVVQTYNSNTIQCASFSYFSVSLAVSLYSWGLSFFDILMLCWLPFLQREWHVNRNALCNLETRQTIWYFVSISQQIYYGGCNQCSEDAT